MKTIPRHLHLIWRILLNRLPVKRLLFQKGVDCFPLCCFCDQHEETSDHLFMECDWSRSIWFASPLGICFDKSETEFNSSSRWVIRIILEENNEIIQLVFTLCYEIWRLRNMKCFEGKNEPNTMIVCKKACENVYFFNTPTELLMQC